MRVAWILAGAASLAACGTSAQTDPLAPACGGNPPVGLASESSGGQCPAHAASLTGTLAAGSPCSQATDCAPACCQCTNGQHALAAQCANGTCLDQGNTCCLYSRQCGH